MIRVVVDANVFVSGPLRPEGAPGRILRMALSEPSPLKILLSRPIVQEVRRALGYSKVQKYLRRRVDPQSWFDDFELVAEVVTEDVAIQADCRDRDDAMYLWTAAAGHAEFVISGDGDLQALTKYRGIPILSPSAFLVEIQHRCGRR
ncbi:MAG: putative toxin-antitoxin system toxin component, PIN family [Acidobacteriota bacterium]